MKRFVLLAVMSVALSCSVTRPVSRTSSSTDGEAEQQVIQLMTRLKEAQIRNDVAALKSIYADEYTLTEGDGTVFTKSERISAIGKLKFASSTLEDVKVRAYGNAAVFTGLATVTFLKEPKGPFSVRVTIVFVNKQGRWQVVAGQETDIIK